MFGITESGDASMNYAWIEKARKMDGNIIITKNLTTKFVEELLKLKNDSVILHATCTGYGGTVLEPNIPPMGETMSAIQNMIDSGWKPERLVFRVDPIIPTEKGLQVFQNVVEAARKYIPEVHRIRISVLDMYPHVAERFKAAHLPHPYIDKFQASAQQFSALNQLIIDLKWKYPELQFETCAETDIPTAEAVGCVSQKDFIILGIDVKGENSKKQRKKCLCSTAKKELLPYNWNATGYNHCYGCLYCYWKTELDKR